MTMIDIRPTLAAKSDQLNADDLIGGPMTITITDVRLLDAADQPVAIHWAGGEGRPYKPCKSMRRVMAKVWGEDGKAFIGQRMTVYRDDKVRFGADAVGGIRISHMSGIERETTMALMVTQGKRAPYTVRPLTEQARRPAQQAAPTNLTLEERAAAFLRRVNAAETVAKLNAVKAAASGLRADLQGGDPELLVECDQAVDAKMKELEADRTAAAGNEGEGGSIRGGPAPLTSDAPLAGMKRGSDLLREQTDSTREAGSAEQAPADPGDPIDPLEWKVEATRYIDQAGDEKTLQGLDAEWTEDGSWERLRAVSEADWKDLFDYLVQRDGEIKRAARS